jgi:hypothetical protein
LRQVGMIVLLIHNYVLLNIIFFVALQIKKKGQFPALTSSIIVRKNGA